LAVHTSHASEPLKPIAFFACDLVSLLDGLSVILDDGTHPADGPGGCHIFDPATNEVDGVTRLGVQDTDQRKLDPPNKSPMIAKRPLDPGEGGLVGHEDADHVQEGKEGGG
jgi:hypothetical protein